jgi:excinuclease ABC subunit C
LNLEEKSDIVTKQLPQKPGVYLFKDSAGKIIYVGKAIKLKNRVKSYFQQNRPRDAKTKVLVSKISDLEIIVTDSEAEALILEDTLIKKHKPRYNILLRDDKTYPYVKITNEMFPKIFVTRNRYKDGAKYIGPITEVGNLRNLMKMLRNLFKLRSCDLNISNESIEKEKHKVCLDFHIKKCEGPCVGFVNSEYYKGNIDRCVKILSGKSREVEKYFEEKMIDASENMEYEKATLFRNNLQILKEFSSKQKVVDSEIIDRDVFGIAREDNLACVIILKIRDGKLIGKRHYIVKNTLDSSDEEIISRSIERWYIETEFVPSEIHLPSEPQEIEYLSGWLGGKRGKTVKIILPKIGDKKKLVEMAGTNAKFVLKEFIIAENSREKKVPHIVKSLQRDLRLSKPPIIIECFDNSHIQGSELVSSMVRFKDGKPNKSEYRLFKNKTVLKNDDFAAMREAVLRRYSRLKEEVENGESEYPDLLIIDGGKGQLSSAMEILNELGIADKFVTVGLAKRIEEVFFFGRSEAVLLPKTSSSLRLIQHARDEAHRFAITYHRKLRSKRTLQTELTKIESIGEKTAKILLENIGSVEEIKKTENNILEKYLNKKQLNNLINYFN